MNWRGGWALIRFTWASWLQYRSFFFVLAFSWMITPLVSLLVWRSAAGEAGSLAGMNQGQFTAYYLILILVNQLTYAQVNWTVGDIIRSGGLNTWLLRPLPPIFNALSSEIAGKVVYSIFTVPVAILLAVLLRPELQTDAVHLGGFAVSLLMAWVLRFCWGLALALLAFWVIRSDALLVLQDSLVFLLGGMVAPNLLLPGAMQTLSKALPFRYMLGFPTEALTAQVDLPGLASGLLIQALWTAVAMGLAWLAWQAGQRHYTAVGG